ncbi:NucA/NucB deoxyribonuclease domain-containing protein [Longispora sp. NPDC051575]|uniref:NucA/NucB deoxyribonuclease domain-containing protein n=1 Tax=Longispora sp. NPDC051575 TaxID=3154943 RepID=UPI003417A000
MNRSFAGGRLRRLLLAALAVTALTAPVAAQPAAATTSSATILTDESDLRAACANKQAATTLPGWFDQRTRHCVRLLKEAAVVRSDGVVLGRYQVTFTLLGFAAGNGSRGVDWVVSLENITFVQGSLDAGKLRLTVNVKGCQNVTNMVCPAANLLQRADLVTGWRTNPKMSRFAFTSPNNTGGGDYKTVNAQMSVDVLQEYLDGQTVPAQSPMILYSNVRYDSAAAALGAKNHGAVFSDPIPTFTLSLSDPSVNESATHIRDAIQYPERTFPSWLGKHPPSTLTRMMSPTLKDKNGTESKKVCLDVWGTYDGNIQNCDEYPFATTYEGAYTDVILHPGNPWNGSARIIDAGDNQHVGRDLLQNTFYAGQRMLDGDTFHVVITP